MKVSARQIAKVDVIRDVFLKQSTKSRLNTITSIVIWVFNFVCYMYYEKFYVVRDYVLIVIFRLWIFIRVV